MKGRTPKLVGFCELVPEDQRLMCFKPYAGPGW